MSRFGSYSFKVHISWVDTQKWVVKVVPFQKQGSFAQNRTISTPSPDKNAKEFCDNPLCCIANKRPAISHAWFKRRVTIFPQRFPILLWLWFPLWEANMKASQWKTRVDIFRCFCPSLYRRQMRWELLDAHSLYMAFDDTHQNFWWVFGSSVNN